MQWRYNSLKLSYWYCVPCQSLLLAAGRVISPRLEDFHGLAERHLVLARFHGEGHVMFRLVMAHIEHVHGHFDTNLRQNHPTHIVRILENGKDNSLAPVRCGSNFRCIISKLIQNSSLGAHCETALQWMPQYLANEKSTLVKVMAWCHQATSQYQYLSQCRPRASIHKAVRWDSGFDFSNRSEIWQAPVKFQSKTIIIISNLMASKLHEIWQ